MADPLTLFGLLGATTAAEAAEKWPKLPFLPGLGVSAGGDDPSDYEPLLAYLNTVLSFAAVRPGSAPDRVGLTAEVVIAPHPAPEPLVLRELPDLAFVLQPNIPDRPARLCAPQPAQDLLGVIQAGRERVLGREPVVHRHHARAGPVRHPAAERVVGLHVADNPAAAVQVDQREAAGRGRLEDPHGHAARRSQVRHRGHLLRDESRAAAAQRQRPVVRPRLLGVAADERHQAGRFQGVEDGAELRVQRHANLPAGGTDGGGSAPPP